MPTVVVGPTESIRDAIDSAGVGGVVSILPGAYCNIILTAKNAGVTIKAADPRTVKIVGTDTDRPIAILEGADRVTIEGLELTGGGREMIGCFANKSEHVTIRNCWVHHNKHCGVGIFNCSASCIEDCLVEHNGDSDLKHGIYTTTGAVIRNNVVRYSSGRGIQLWENASGNLVSGNVVYGNTYGALVMSGKQGSQNVVVENTLIHTKPNEYAAVQVWNSTDDIVADNVIRCGMNSAFDVRPKNDALLASYVGGNLIQEY